MSDENMDTQDAIENSETVDIGTLRKAAKALGIQAERTWVRDDFVRAIKQRQQDGSGTLNFLVDGASQPPPGYARVIVHRNPTPGHKNTPIHVGHNGTLFQVPRGLEVDMPKEFLNSLKDAITKETREVEPGKYVEEDQMSYPFQVLAITPGQWKNPNDNRAASYRIRKEFMDMHGVWPTAAELREFKSARTKKNMA